LGWYFPSLPKNFFVHLYYKLRYAFAKTKIREKLSGNSLLFRSLGEGQLGLLDDFRTLKWVEIIPYPEMLLKQSKELLQIT